MTAAIEIGTELSGSKADPPSPNGADPGGQPASPSESEGDSARRLNEAGYALHRAAVTLEGMGLGTLAQSWTTYRQTPYGETPSPLDAGAGSMSVLNVTSTRQWRMWTTWIARSQLLRQASWVWRRHSFTLTRRGMSLLDKSWSSHHRLRTPCMVRSSVSAMTWTDRRYVESSRLH